MDIDKAKTISELLKNVAEIAALLIAGIWAYFHFLETETPSLEFRPYSESTLNWYRTPRSQVCLGRFGVTIKNIGKTSFDVNHAETRVWIADYPQPDGAVEFIDPTKLEIGIPIFKKDYDANSIGLLGHYPPGATGEYHFTFNFKSDTSKLAFFSFDGFDKRHQKIQIHESRWSFICDVG